MREVDCIGGLTGGIPKQLFYWDSSTKGHTQRVGEGDRQLSVLVDMGKIHIKDHSGEYHFTAEMDYSAGGMTAVTFDIVTVSNAGQRHPDLYAKELLMASIELFKIQGFTINTILGIWMAPPLRSINYTMFQEALRGIQTLEKDLSIEDQYAQAARYTWTGHIAFELGFTDAFAFKSGNDILVSFNKPITGGLNMQSI